MRALSMCAYGLCQCVHAGFVNVCMRALSMCAGQLGGCIPHEMHHSPFRESNTSLMLLACMPSAEPAGSYPASVEQTQHIDYSLTFVDRGTIVCHGSFVSADSV